MKTLRKIKSPTKDHYLQKIIDFFGGLTMPAFFYVLLFGLVMSCKEKNPYAGRYGSQLDSSAKNNPSTNGTANPGSPAPAGPAGASGPASSDPAKGGSIPKSSLAGVQLLCSSADLLKDFEAEYAAICVSGQATKALAAGLAAPYKGGSGAAVNLLRSEDSGGTSDLMVLAVLEVPKLATEVFGKRAVIAANSLSAGNAKMVTSVVSESPGSGNILAGMEVRSELNVSIAIISVKNVSVAASEFYALNPEKTVYINKSKLKAGAPDNKDDILANSLSVFLQEGTSTKIISVNHQKANNRGQHKTAQDTITGIGAATMTATYNSLMK